MNVLKRKDRINGREHNTDNNVHAAAFFDRAQTLILTGARRY